jgi:PhnB protein
MTSMNSTTEPGHPCVMTSASARTSAGEMPWSQPDPASSSGHRNSIVSMPQTVLALVASLRGLGLAPYLNFNGNARQALEFYNSVFGGTLTLTTFADFGAAGSPDADRIMHGQLETAAGYTIMAADVTSEMPYQQLSASGAVTMPMQKQAWGDEFGMCVDQFGVPWLVNIGQPQP